MDLGFVRVAAAVPAVRVADCGYNTGEIVKLLEEADRLSVAIVVFPELCVTGYTCGDLYNQELLVKGAEESLSHLVADTSGLSTVAVVGVPVRRSGRLYNCAAVIGQGKVYGIVPKTYIPNYGEFYEGRWFESGAGFTANSYIDYCGNSVPFTTRALFGCGKMHLAVEICEDLWAPAPPSSEHAVAGANLIANLSASDELVGKNDWLKSLALQQSARTYSAYIYSSAGFGESSTDLVFSGNGIITENGVMLARSERFTMRPSMTVSDVDIDFLENRRAASNTFTSAATLPDYLSIDIPLRNYDYSGDPERQFNPAPFIPAGKEDLDKTCSEVFDIQVLGLCNRYLHTGSQSAVIGVSGGLDSTLALLVTVEAFDRLSIPRTGITAVTMPGFGTSGRTYSNAITLMKELGVTMREIDIKPACIQHFSDIGLDPADRSVTFENVQARERTQVLMDIANMTGGMVIGTGDLSELALGWATYNGDLMSMYGVNASVPKTLIRSMVSWAAERSENPVKECLLDITDTPVSPELLPVGDDKIQDTEGSVGPYELHDFFLYHFIRTGARPAKIHYMALHAFEGKYESEEIKKWLVVFLKRFFSQQFKRSVLPDGPKVGTVSLSPRGDWRMPSDATSRMWVEEAEKL